MSTWHLFIDKFKPEHIQKCTITEAYKQTTNEEFCLTNDKLLALIAVLYAREVTGSNIMPHYTIWTDYCDVPLCRLAILTNGFSEIYVFSALTISLIDLKG